MAIQKEFILRYRNDGHLRFQIPARLCEASTARLIVDHVSAIPGVSSVRLYRGQQKLSIRYSEAILDCKTLARRLYDVLEVMRENGCFTENPVAKPGILEKLSHNKIGDWFGEKYQAGKETLRAARLLGKIGVQGPKALIKDPEKAVVDFLNDVLVLYLIRVHWTRITQEWLVRPFAYRYEWMAVFYLFYLLVRSRRKK